MSERRPNVYLSPKALRFVLDALKRRRARIQDANDCYLIDAICADLERAQEAQNG